MPRGGQSSNKIIDILKHTHTYTHTHTHTHDIDMTISTNGYNFNIAMCITSEDIISKNMLIWLEGSKQHHCTMYTQKFILKYQQWVGKIVQNLSLK